MKASLSTLSSWCIGDSIYRGNYSGNIQNSSQQCAVWWAALGRGSWISSETNNKNHQEFTLSIESRRRNTRELYREQGGQMHYNNSSRLQFGQETTKPPSWPGSKCISKVNLMLHQTDINLTNINIIARCQARRMRIVKSFVKFQNSVHVAFIMEPWPTLMTIKKTCL